MKISAWLLLLAEIFFLATFLAAEPLEILADNGELAHSDAVYLYASRWRHGMTPGSQFYMPGFFAVAVTVWFWALRKPLPQILREGAMLTGAALILAFLLQPKITANLLEHYQADTGAWFYGFIPENSVIGVFRSIYTLVTFAVGIVSIQIAAARRRLLPLALPVAMNVVLSQIRPWTVGDFTGYWARQTLALNPVAVFTTLSVVSAALVMAVAQIIASRPGAGRRVAAGILVIATLAIAPLSLHAQAGDSSLRWIQRPASTSVQYNYVMTARVRLLVPWFGADDVGGGYIRRSGIADDPAVRRIEVLFGSDPAKAPRSINHWGAAIEAFDGKSSAMLGFMKAQKTGSASDAEAEIRRQKELGEHPFDAIFHTANADSAITRKITLKSDTDLDIHHMAKAQQLAVGQLERSTKTKELRGSALKCNSGKGFLQTVDDLTKVGLKSSATPRSLCYTHNAKNYIATLTSSKAVASRTITFQKKKGPKVTKTYTDLMEMEFEVLNQASGERSEFELLVGTAGNLQGVPVQIVHQPNWWFKVILNLDTVERSNS